MSQSYPLGVCMSAAVATALAFGLVPDASAQMAQERAKQRAEQAEQKDGKAAVQPATQFPDASRKEPEAKASAKLGPKLQKMFDAYEKNDAAAVVALADEIIANDKANAYERAISARLAGATLLNSDEAKAQTYLEKVIEFDGLNNNEHFESMFILAQLQLQDQQYAKSLATIDKFLAETKSQKPEYLVLKGNALYRLERFPEAATVLKQAVTSAPEPKPEWLQLLMGAYVEMKQPAEAAKIAQDLTAKNPDDKRMQMNLASIYMQTEQTDQAVAVLEKLRTGGQLTEDRDYRNLFALYSSAEGKEKETIAVINEGLEKGILKPDQQVYVALAQAYYFSEQPKLAIDAYRKAAPLATDGEVSLNLAKVLWQEGQVAEAKQAAQQALDKGVKKPDDAQKILALPGK